MAERSFIENHVEDSLHAAAVETLGAGAASRRMKAAIRLRFISMSDEDLLEMALITSSPPEYPLDAVFLSYKEDQENLKATADEWMKYLLEDVAEER